MTEENTSSSRRRDHSLRFMRVYSISRSVARIQWDCTTIRLIRPWYVCDPMTSGSTYSSTTPLRWPTVPSCADIRQRQLAYVQSRTTKAWSNGGWLTRYTPPPPLTPRHFSTPTGIAVPIRHTGARRTQVPLTLRNDPGPHGLSSGRPKLILRTSGSFGQTVTRSGGYRNLP